MKSLLTLIVGFALAVSAQADVSLRFAYFSPAGGSINLYVSDDGFARTAPVQLSALSGDQQAAVQSALGWLALQLPAGFTEIDQVIMEPGPLVATAWDEEEQPTAWSRTLNAAVTGRGPKGSRVVQITDAPPEIRTALLALWDTMESALNQPQEE